MTGFFADKKRTVSAALTLASAVSIGCIAACIISAAPRDNHAEPQMTAADEPIRITAPIDDAITSLLDPAVTREPETEASAPTTVTTHTDNIKVDAPEITTEMETNAPETTAPQTTEEVTTAPETTEAVSTAPETTAAPETTNDEPFYVVPEIKEGLLADELSVVHTINKPNCTVTDEEIILAATIIQLEVMGNGSSLYRFDDITEKYWEMCAVAQCIRNRTDSKWFPNTPKEVMLQSHKLTSGKIIYQFSPAEKLSQFTPTDEAIVAAREVLIEGVTVLPADYYYFCATRIESTFEKTNTYMLIKKSDGSYDKTQGHLTTFYAGRE